jgi:hypothetical protein
MPPAESVFLTASLDEFTRYRTRAEKTLEQLDDADFHVQLDPESNSIAILIQHVSGNLKSHWSEFLTTDGEKPWRERDAEFIDQNLSRAELMALWNEGMGVLYTTLNSLTPGDLTKTITIRGEPHTVVRAIQRGLAHLGYHTGQIILLAKLIKRGNFKSVSIPRGQSKTFKP